MEQEEYKYWCSSYNSTCSSISFRRFQFPCSPSARPHPNPLKMGHYSSTDEQRLSHTHDQLSFYASVKDHFSLKQSNTSLVISERIRELYPHKHVTIVQSRHCDILGFAAAGHADVRLITSDQSFLPTRTYSPPSSRMEGGEGKLGEDVSIGQYEYEWEGIHFPLFKVS